MATGRPWVPFRAFVGPSFDKPQGLPLHRWTWGSGCAVQGVWSAEPQWGQGPAGQEGPGCSRQVCWKGCRDLPRPPPSPHAILSSSCRRAQRKGTSVPRRSPLTPKLGAPWFGLCPVPTAPRGTSLQALAVLGPCEPYLGQLQWSLMVTALQAACAWQSGQAKQARSCLHVWPGSWVGCVFEDSTG